MNKNLLLGVLLLFFVHPLLAQMTYVYTPLERTCHSIVQYVYLEIEGDSLFQKSLTEQENLQGIEERIYLVFSKKDSVMVYANQLLQNESSEIHNSSASTHPKHSSLRTSEGLRRVEKEIERRGEVPMDHYLYYSYCLVAVRKAGEFRLWDYQLRNDSLTQSFKRYSVRQRNDR